MNDHDFDRAIAALREQGEQPAPQARVTRERILRDLRPKAGRRRAVWLIPLAALLAGSTVLAATGRLTEAYHAAARALGLEATTPVVAPQPSHARPVEARPAEPPPQIASPPPPAAAEASHEEAAVDVDAGTVKHARRILAKPHIDESAVTRPEPSAPPAAESPAEDDTGNIALYRKARQLHFIEQKPAAALAAWDAYRAAEPRGPLAVDARYDRGLCLLRLGRKEEARVALAPFADGKYGSYRQKEARALLDAMK